MTKISFSKRALMMFLVAWITFVSVFSAYKQTTYCAEWIAGTIASVGGAPILTALLIGGVVVAGGVAIYELSQTDMEDHRNFVSGIKQGFNEFVSEQEKQIALEQNSSLSDQEASDIGVQNAREYVDNFFDNAVETTKNTAENLKKKAVDYWKLYSTIIGDVADYGIPDIPDVDITPNSVYKSNAFNLSNFNVSASFTGENTGSNAVEIDDVWYSWRGNLGMYTNNNEVVTTQYTSPRAPSNVYRLPFAVIYSNGSSVFNRACYIDYDITTLQYVSYGTNSEYTLFKTNTLASVEAVMSACVLANTLPTFIINSVDNLPNVVTLLNNYDGLKRYLGIGNAQEVPTYKRTVNEALENTKMGNSIRTGRRQLVNDGDHIISVFKEDSVPVKKSGMKVNEGTVSGQVGWDIPAGDVWDDVYSGGKPYADVVGGTGAVGVPDDVITGTKSGDTVVEYPEDAVVQDSADYPRDDTDDKPEELPEKPQQDVFENQGGEFFPNAFDLTNIFPFCIPFDIIYLVEKFDVGGEQAPVINIPIVYPNAIRGAMGSDSYTVTIDFQDYIVVRNVIRVFLLILFIAGLMKITRDLIRG